MPFSTMYSTVYPAFQALLILTSADFRIFHTNYICISHTYFIPLYTVEVTLGIYEMVYREQQESTIRAGLTSTFG